MTLEDLFEGEGSSEDPGTGWTDREFEAILGEIGKTSHGLTDLKELAKEVIEKYNMKRTPHGVLMAMVRMSTIIHGVMPEGVTTKSAETWFKSPGTIAKFLNKKGYDVDVRLRKVRAVLDKRIASDKKKMPRGKAIEVMVSYHKENKATLPKDIGKRRENIITDIMKGASAEEAFARAS